MIDIEKISIEKISSNYFSEIQKFQCSDKREVENFLKNFALKYHENSLAKTHLVFYDQEFIGYFSLFSDHVTVPKSKRNAKSWELNSIIEKQMFPSIRIHYMGITDIHRRKGFGTYLLYIALDTCKEINESVACTFIALEALEGTVGFYKKYNFEILSKPKTGITNMIFKLDEL